MFVSGFLRGRTRSPSASPVPAPAFRTVLAVALLALSRGSSALAQQGVPLLPGQIDFDVPLEIPEIDRFVTNLRLPRSGDLVEIDAQLRFDSKGRIVCNGRCTVDGVPVGVRGKIKKRKTGGGWSYKIVLKSDFEPRIVVKASGVHGASVGKVSYRGPKGRYSSRKAPVVLLPSPRPVIAHVRLFPVVAPGGRITGTGEFSAGFGDARELSGTLKGRLVGQYLAWTLRGGKKKLSFAGFFQGENLFRGQLKIVMPPEKRVAGEFIFPRTITVFPEPPQNLERQRPFVLRFTFPLVDRRTGTPIRSPRQREELDAGDAGSLPAAADFHIFEDEVEIDSTETNQFLTSNSLKPIDLALVLDYSGSMERDLEAMVAAARTFVGTLSRNTRLSVSAFWERGGGRQRLTDFIQCTGAGKTEVVAAIESFTDRFRNRELFHGASEIRDALFAGIRDLPPAQPGVSRGVVILSDGRDTSSTRSADEILREAQERGAAIYPIGFGVDSEEDRRWLETLAERTGGEAFFGGELDRLFSRVADKLVSEWVLTYVTLKTSGVHVVRVESAFKRAPIELSGVFEIDDGLRGDIRRGELVARPARVTPATSAGPLAASAGTPYQILAAYIPRGITFFRLRLTAGADRVDVQVPDGESPVNKKEWAVLDEGDGWYRLFNTATPEPNPLRYGSFGAIADVTVQGDTPLAVEIDSSEYPDGQTFILLDGTGR